MFEGDAVTLRAFGPDDVGTVHGWYADREVMRNMGSRYPTPASTIAKKLTQDWAQPTYARTMLAAEAEGRLIGLCGLHHATPEVRDAEADLLIGDRSVWGKGYGTDAMRVLCRFGFEQMGLHRIHLWVYTRNVAAVRVYEKVGFSHEGIARQSWFKDGEFLDAHLMSLLEGELLG